MTIYNGFPTGQPIAKIDYKSQNNYPFQIDLKNEYQYYLKTDRLDTINPTSRLFYRSLTGELKFILLQTSNMETQRELPAIIVYSLDSGNITKQKDMEVKIGKNYPEKEYLIDHSGLLIETKDYIIYVRGLNIYGNVSELLYIFFKSNKDEDFIAVQKPKGSFGGDYIFKNSTIISSDYNNNQWIIVGDNTNDIYELIIEGYEASKVTSSKDIKYNIQFKATSIGRLETKVNNPTVGISTIDDERILYIFGGRLLAEPNIIDPAITIININQNSNIKKTMDIPTIDMGLIPVSKGIITVGGLIECYDKENANITIKSKCSSGEICFYDSSGNRTIYSTLVYPRYKPTILKYSDSIYVILGGYSINSEENEEEVLTVEYLTIKYDIYGDIEDIYVTPDWRSTKNTFTTFVPLQNQETYHCVNGTFYDGKTSLYQVEYSKGSMYLTKGSQIDKTGEAEQIIKENQEFYFDETFDGSVYHNEYKGDI